MQACIKTRDIASKLYQPRNLRPHPLSANHSQQHLFRYGCEISAAAGKDVIQFNWISADTFQRVAPAAAGAAMVGMALFPKTVLHAEGPAEIEVNAPFSILQ